MKEREKETRGGRAWRCLRLTGACRRCERMSGGAREEKWRPGVVGGLEVLLLLCSSGATAGERQQQRHPDGLDALLVTGGSAVRRGSGGGNRDEEVGWCGAEYEGGGRRGLARSDLGESQVRKELVGEAVGSRGDPERILWSGGAE